MVRGRPPVPTEVKRRRGTLRVSRTPGPLTIVPALPASKVGNDTVADALRAIGAPAWLAQSDEPVLRLAQQLADDHARLRAALDDGFDRNVFAAYIATTKELSACLSKLGLTPSDRSRLGVAEVKARSKLEEIMDRRAGRHAS